MRIMKTENGQVYLEIGDVVEDSLTGTELTIVDIFDRDGVRLVELTNGRGSSTTTVPGYLRVPKRIKIKN